MTTSISTHDSIRATSILDSWESYSNFRFYSLDVVELDDNDNVISRESAAIDTIGEIEYKLNRCITHTTEYSTTQKFYSMRQVSCEEAYTYFKGIARF